MKFFVLSYLVVSIVLLTLNPFTFQPFAPSEFWVWRFSIEDFSRNVLLFFPFGIALSQLFCKRLLAVLLCGFLLSLAVEVAQLFIELRTSNFVDLISNSSGTLLGGLFCQCGFSKGYEGNDRTQKSILLACLFIPLCWISAMRSLWTLPAVITIFVSAIASLTLIQSALTTQPKKSVIALFWLSLCYLPVLNANLLAGCFLLATIPIVIPLTAMVRQSAVPKRVVLLAAIALLLILTLNSFWYFTNNDPGWTNNEHLRLSESLLSAATLLACFLWQKSLQAKLNA